MAQEPTLVVVKDADAMSQMAAEIVAEVLTIRSTAPISLPTGSTPVGMFEKLIAASQANELDLSRFQLFCLDEYLGVTQGNPNTLTSWLKRFAMQGIWHWRCLASGTTAISPTTSRGQTPIRARA